MSEKNGQAKPLEQAKLPWYYTVYNTIRDTPINLTLIIVSAFVFYKVVTISRQRRNLNRVRNILGCANNNDTTNSQLPPLQRDFTVKELFEFNGTRADGRILVAVNFNIYDVSCDKDFFGENGTYPQYAGCDISRSLINFSAERIESKGFDDLDDLNDKEMGTLLEWDQQYSEKYPLVGHLVRDAEPPVFVANAEDNTQEIEILLEQYKM